MLQHPSVTIDTQASEQQFPPSTPISNIDPVVATLGRQLKNNDSFFTDSGERIFLLSMPALPITIQLKSELYVRKGSCWGEFLRSFAQESSQSTATSPWKRVG